MTGGTGLVGRNLISNLLRNCPERRITVLARETSRNVPAGERVRVVQGDLSRPGLGMTAGAWDELRSSVTEIVHSGASIRFDLPLETARAVNLAGTESVLALARGCGRLRKLAHVSTTFIAGRHAGSLPEAPFRHGDGFFSSYQESKYEAEQAVLASDLPAAVYRLSSVIGNFRTGEVEQYNHFHQLLRLVPCNPLPVLPCAAGGQVDFVASDWVSEALATLVERHFHSGFVWNLCAGPRHALPVAEVIESAFATLGKGRPPELVSPEEFERFTGERIARGDRRLGTVLQALRYLLPYFSLRQDFESARTEAVLAGENVRYPDSRELLRGVLEACGRSVNEPAGTSGRAGLDRRPSNTVVAG